MQNTPPEKIAQIALENSGLGYFHVLLQTGEMSYSPMYSIIITGEHKIAYTRSDFVSYLHPEDKSIRDKAYANAEQSGKLEYQVRTIWNNGSQHWIHVRGTYLTNEDGKRYILTGTIDDITDRVNDSLRVRESEKQLRSLIKEAPFATALYRGRELIIDTANAEMIKLWGKDETVINKPLHLALPELEGQDFLEILDEVYTTGNAYHTQEALVNLEIGGILRGNYYSFTYKPLNDSSGEVYAIINMAVDVTDQVMDRRQIEESELFSKSIFYNSPVAKVVFTGAEMIVKTINEKMLLMIGRDETIINKPLLEAIPELGSTELLHRLRHVYATGDTYYQPEEKIILSKNGSNYTGYYNYIYKPLYNTANDIYGIMVTATEVTEQVLSRQKVEIAEYNLRSAIELAELATWSINLITNEVEYSERMREWCGIEPNEPLDINSIYKSVIEQDRNKIDTFITQAILTKGRTATEMEFTVRPLNGGLERIIQSQGKCFVDENGEPYKITGTSQDVTVQRKLRMALEQQVLARTEELQAVNEKLTAANEELFESNSHLMHSNEELAQYAYVASHDLQEPLRKIRMFTDILRKNQTSRVDNREIVQKINKSAERMSLLIEGLLEFSRLLKSDILFEPVDLNYVVSQVKSDFELIIQEKEAVINIQSLTIIEAISLQMNQLFYNLIGNALKFTRPGVRPQISIRAEILDSRTAQKIVPTAVQFPEYYHVMVEDNGIGIEPQYADQIFDVFKRLHPRDLYPGSGIGLALCRRIVSNHNGYVFMESIVGQGTTCHVLLPLKRGKHSQQSL
ncbi:PAS domain-containing sensor histidine kinase [Flavitalea antarctica]